MPAVSCRASLAWSRGCSCVTSETTTNGRAGTRAERLPSRRELFALAAVLAATALTAGAAIAGLTRSPGAPPASTPTVDQVITPAPSAPRRVEPGD